MFRTFGVLDKPNVLVNLNHVIWFEENTSFIDCTNVYLRNGTFFITDVNLKYIRQELDPKYKDN